MAKHVSLDELAAHFERLAIEAPAITQEAARITAPVLAEAIKTTIGNLDELTPLKPSTIERKANLGYAEPSSPLYATGDLRESVTPAAIGNAAMAGSNEEKSRWHEYGTSHIPPRPAFRIGLAKALPIARQIARGIVRMVMTKT